MNRRPKFPTCSEIDDERKGMDERRQNRVISTRRKYRRKCKEGSLLLNISWLFGCHSISISLSPLNFSSVQVGISCLRAVSSSMHKKIRGQNDKENSYSVWLVSGSYTSFWHCSITYLVFHILSNGDTCGRAWMTVSSRALIPTAIFSSFNTVGQRIRTSFNYFCIPTKTDLCLPIWGTVRGLGS